MPNEHDLSPGALELGELVRGYQAAVDDFDREIARLMGVNETDMRCLEILLQDLPDAAPSELAARLSLTSGSVTTMLDRLERSGLITRSPHPSDRRKAIIRATPLAANRAEALIAPLISDGSRELLPRYSSEQIEVIADFLRRARDLQQRHVDRLRATHPIGRDD
jgi:DNA-binding MarR family transcriptional regulator